MSEHRTIPLLPEGEDLLQASSHPPFSELIQLQLTHTHTTQQAALSDPFSIPPNLPRVSPSQPPPSSEPTTPPETPASVLSLLSSPSTSISVSSAEQEAWRISHEAQVSEWRQQSARERVRAEAVRARWEEQRRLEQAAQQQQGQRQGQGQQGQVGYGGGGSGGGVTRGDSIMSVSVSGESASATSVSGEWEAVSQRSASASASALASSTAASPSPPDNAPGVRSAPSHSLQSLESQRPQARHVHVISPHISSPSPSSLSSPRANQWSVRFVTYLAGPASVHKQPKRTRAALRDRSTTTAPRPDRHRHDGRLDRLAALGKPALVSDLFVPIHVLPRAIAPALARAFTSRARRPGNGDHDTRGPLCASGLCDPRRV